MIFKYRGTTIRLFSTKLFILVMVAVGAIFAVLSLHEIITFNSTNHSDSLPNATGRLNPSVTRLRQEGIVAAPAFKEGNNAQAATKKNINISPQAETIKRLNRTMSPEIAKLREFVGSANAAEFIRNKEKFGSKFSQTSIVIVVQIHDRVDYFSRLLKSLSHAKGIEDALLIISSDFYTEEIYKHVDSIDFCRVIHMFFPFSDQLYPNEFPGTDPNDCPRDIPKAKAKEIGCINAETPDMYGHYREARFTMTKHHWWWKANKVFDALNATKTYVGPVLFLEEDYYVSPDFYHMLRLLYDSKTNECKEDCDLITLGTYTFVDNYEAGGAKNMAELSEWNSHEHNMGLAFDRATWNKIKRCSEVFCKTYDDYNWDWSLMKMSLSCLSRPLKSLVLKGPRVFHLGECGLHHKKADCNIDATVQKYQSVIDRNLNSFYPSSVDIQHGRTGSTSKFSPNGGWGDPRDHALCLQFMQSR